MAKYRGKSVRLNRPTRIRKGQPGYGRKKSQVYVKTKSQSNSQRQAQLA